VGDFFVGAAMLGGLMIFKILHSIPQTPVLRYRLLMVGVAVLSGGLFGLASGSIIAGLLLGSGFCVGLAACLLFPDPDSWGGLFVSAICLLGCLLIAAVSPLKDPGLFLVMIPTTLMGRVIMKLMDEADRRNGHRPDGSQEQRPNV
jgi:hypothetical protein